jgi:hypothetical protein
MRLPPPSLVERRVAATMMSMQWMIRLEEVGPSMKCETRNAEQGEVIRYGSACNADFNGYIARDIACTIHIQCTNHVNAASGWPYDLTDARPCTPPALANGRRIPPMRIQTTTGRRSGSGMKAATTSTTRWSQNELDANIALDASERQDVNAHSKYNRDSCERSAAALLIIQYAVKAVQERIQSTCLPKIALALPKIALVLQSIEPV